MSLKEIVSEYENNKKSKPEYIKEMHGIHDYLFEYSQYIKGKDIQKIEIMDDVVIMTSRSTGIKIICDPNDHRIAPIEILNFNEYEKDDSEMIHNLVQDNDCVFDIGANIGWYSISLSKEKNNVEIHAFEPIPKTYEYLIANTKLNGCSNVTIYNHGLSNENKDIVFHYYPEGSGNASMRELNDDMDNIQINSKVMRLDDFIVDKNIEKIDFIKCDVEGAELLVFEGAESILTNQQPIVFTELLRKWSVKYDYHPNDMIAYFKSLNYMCFTVKDKKLIPFATVDEDTVETNYFFLPLDKIDSLKRKKLIEE